MKAELIESKISRQNILNNEYAINEIQKTFEFNHIEFEGKLRLLKEEVASFFEIDIRTVERYIEKYNNELIENGYEILRGQRLKDFIELYNSHGTDIDVGTIHKRTSVLGVFDFKSFLNLAMLLTDSENAKVVRQIILDITIDTLNKKVGGSTKYINQRDEDFLDSWFNSDLCRKEFTNALKNYVEGGKSKYGIYTNKIYTSIFKEKADEYREILKLSEKDKIRDTMYSEVLDIISSFEIGLAEEIEKKFNAKGSRISFIELNKIFEEFANQKALKPFIKKARNKMASRDYEFRDALHIKLQDYITPVSTEDYERFLGEKSKELLARLEENKEVLKRLKDMEE